jgi:hypothetical protein
VGEYLEVHVVSASKWEWRARCPICGWRGAARRHEVTAADDLAVHVDAQHGGESDE